MRAVRHVAVNVFRESVRDRVLYNLVLFAVLLIGSSYLLAQLTAGQDVKIIKDLGLAAMSLFGLFIAVFIGIGLVSKEVEKRSIYALLSKPISRPQFIAGKYAGLVLTLAVNVAVMTVALYGVLGYLSWIETPDFKASWEAPGPDPALLTAIGDRAVLLDVLEPDPVGGADLRSVYRRQLQRRLEELRAGGRLARRGLARARPLPRPARPVCL
jgi:hypothetical protein